jgi:hypothetical protein
VDLTQAFNQNSIHFPLTRPQTVDKLQHAGDLWLLSADDASTLMDAVMESFRIQDQNVRGLGVFVAPALAH